MNCQCQGHASWEKSKCNAWEQRIRERESLRIALFQRGAEVEREFYRRKQKGMGNKEKEKESEALPSRKRGRAGTIQRDLVQQVAQPKRRPGRPRFNEGELLSSQPLVSSFLESRGGPEDGTDVETQEDMEMGP